jgi:Family of unknown function (DUF5681)
VKNDNRNNSETGYGKPPVNTRFKKGQSGNPKGRPKGSRSFTSSAYRVLQERVTINEGGRRKTVTKLDAALKQIANKAASGDANTLRLLVTIVQLMEQRSSDPPTPVDRLDEGDEKLVARLLARVQVDDNGGSGE